jgi:hypothetical protein
LFGGRKTATPRKMVIEVAERAFLAYHDQER